ncbi:hypothetical protein DSM3645_20397 [Blastopirellula marina DSM 3645]|uniref:Uncharacterized protein n=1 Tax=Blastopirellula marina DSM 3645 TaxID=314230 RepID=A3ZQN1_9BACT|nr:hypothetical protein DSM3645_20397 [Blastopirellula marina DSM 3645]
MRNALTAGQGVFRALITLSQPQSAPTLAVFPFGQSA